MRSTWRALTDRLACEYIRTRSLLHCSLAQPGQKSIKTSLMNHNRLKSVNCQGEKTGVVYNVINVGCLVTRCPRDQSSCGVGRGRGIPGIRRRRRVMIHDAAHRCCVALDKAKAGIMRGRGRRIDTSWWYAIVVVSRRCVVRWLLCQCAGPRISFPRPTRRVRAQVWIFKLLPRVLPMLLPK